jgi:hypothetical protein
MIAWFALLACSGTPLEGRVVDGLTGQPLPDFSLMAKATESTGMGCTAFSAKTDAEGRFRIDNACAVPYALTPVKADDVDVWFADGDQVPAGRGGAVEVQAWRTPTAPGVYRLAGGEYEPLRTASDLKTRDLSGVAEKVSFPAKLPEKIPLVAPGDQLVLVGKENVEAIAPAPLLASRDVVYKERDIDITQKDWVYLGIRVNPGPPPVVEQVGARFDPAKVRSVAKGERNVAFVSSDALAAGRYALSKPGDKRIYVVDFGAAQPPPAAPPAPEAPEAAAPSDAPG